ncbi:energy-coupling factor transporter transmembrane component T family protein [Alkalibacterium olivapovliticus]|uniref:Energy-coupling factor transporter transmembrane protein EcfT n=1 Tax=Alkalibacterium olivapovliticus TaxID=99907 RepID=A0A2T0VU30_9LACT|nr:energy-coupling factor transporter transmembrane component T [Alkalibacterium olivapovliticus]PRY74854.1 energy-coupling factor transporter transmembrane protein EcfT [Alkalibacterium olivapovliticus]
MIDSINPTAKTVGILLGSIILGLTFQWQVNLFVVILCLLFLVTSKRTDPAKLAKIMIPIALISVSYFFTGWLFSSEQALFSGSADPAAIIGGSDLTNGLNLSTRILSFAMLGISYSLTTDSGELIASFIQQAKMPMKMGYAILTAINLTSLIHREYDNSKLALQVRNIPVKPFDTKPLFTMMVRMIRWSERLALAMEAKGFSEDRVMQMQMTIKSKDILFSVGLPVLIAVMGFIVL